MADVAGDVDALVGRLLPAWLQRQGALLSVKDAASGAYVQVNAAMAQWLGRSSMAEVVGRADGELLDAPLVTALRAAEQTVLAQPLALTSEHRFEWRGARHDFAVWRQVVVQPDGRRLICAIWTDQAPRKRQEAQLRAALEQLEQQQRLNEQLRREIQDHSLRDAATGLYQGARFEDQLCREVDLSVREHREFAVARVALDAPSERVAALGPIGRARVLEALGRLLRSNIRAMDGASRLDEDRFAVLLSGVGLATAHSRMEQLRRQCATQIVVHEGQELGFSVSMGVASFPHTARTQEELLQSCEAALAEAQRRGGNQVALASIRFEAVRG